MGVTLPELRGLSVRVIAPPDPERRLLVEQLARIGCAVSTHWPPPVRMPSPADVVFVSIDDAEIAATHRLLEAVGADAPTMLALVGYENPATLQRVLEHGFQAIVERPVRSFGLLANLVIARTLWLQHQRALKALHDCRRRSLGDQKVNRAKAVLMAARSISEEAAYRELRARAQSSRRPIEAVADEVLDTQRREAASRAASAASGVVAVAPDVDASR